VKVWDITRSKKKSGKRTERGVGKRGEVGRGDNLIFSLWRLRSGATVYQSAALLWKTKGLWDSQNSPVIRKLSSRRKVTEPENNIITQVLRPGE